MEHEDPEKRIAELERQLADAKAARKEGIGLRPGDRRDQAAPYQADQPYQAEQHVTGQARQFSDAQTVASQDAVFEHARRLAEALREERMPTGRPSGPRVAQLREALTRAAVDAGLPQEQYKVALERAGLRAGGTIKIGGQVVYQHCDPHSPVFLAPMGRQALAPTGLGLGGQAGFSAPPVDGRLAPAPRKIPAAFWLAELLPFRWWYVFALFMVAVTPIALWIQLPIAFPIAAVLTVAVIYAFQFRFARDRIALLKWGQVATVAGTQILSRATYYSGTTWRNVPLPLARGWRVERPMYSGPSTKTLIGYTVNGSAGELVVRGREYYDGVVLADLRNPARALCVTSFCYDLDRDESGKWIGRVRPTLKLGMAVWSILLVGWLAAAATMASAATGLGFGAYLFGTAVPTGGHLSVGGDFDTKTIACNEGHLSLTGFKNTFTVTGH
ncbi:MAG: hypothetical protein QOH07_1249, partial [Mycobacterium sp.]|nr:hypothetical protein [Mycobacterium sp.]